MDCSSSYYEVFYTQFFTTLGQLTAATVSAAVVMPMYEFYVPKMINYLKSKNE